MREVWNNRKQGQMTQPNTIETPDNRLKHEELKRFLEKLLLKYIKKYLKKDFAMDGVFISIRKKLRKQEEITERQFNAIIKFVERERAFRTYNRTKIYEYFSPIISKTKDKIPVATLDAFFDED